MRHGLLASLALAGLLVPTAVAAVQPATHVVISEVLFEPTPEYEWMELHNPTSEVVVIDHWTIDDGGAPNEGEWRFPATHPRRNYGIAPGGSIIIAQNATQMDTLYCGIVPDFALVVGASGAVPIELMTSDSVQFGNSGDAIYLRHQDGTLVDAMGWGTTELTNDLPSTTPPDWHSVAREDPAYEGNETATHQELTEVLSESFKVVRTTDAVGGTYHCTPDTVTVGHAGPTKGGLVVFPYISGLTRTTVPAGSGQVAVTIQGKAFQDGATVTFSGDGISVRDVQWVSSEAISAVLDLRPSAGTGLRDVTVTNPDGYDDTLTGAFEITAHQVVPASTVVISELLVDSADGDPAGEWIELHNPTTGYAVLDGWTLTDGSATWILPDPVPGHDELILAPGTSVVVARDADVFQARYGIDPDLALVPGATSAWALTQQDGVFELQDASGFVHLYDAVGILVDAVAWGLTQPADAPTYPTFYTAPQGETLLRVARHDTGGEQGGPLNERLVEAFETSGAVVDPFEGPEVGGFEPVPLVHTVSPAEGEQGETGLAVTVTGENFVSGSVVSISDEGVTVTSKTYVSPTRIDVVLAVATDAPVSLRDVLVTNPSGYIGRKPAGFRVLAPVPRILTVSPASVLQGATETVSIVGENTHFAAGDSQVLLGDGTGYAVNSISVLDPTHLDVSVTFMLDADLGLWPVRVSTSAANESATGTDLLEIVALPRVVSAVPDAGNQGDALTVTVTGQYTHFDQATTTVDFGADIAVLTPLRVLGPTTLEADVVIGDAAALGLRSVTVTTGGEVATSPTPVFEVLPRPAVKTVTPDTAFQGDRLYVSLEGLNTSWAHGTSAATFGAGVDVLSLTVTGPRSAVVEVEVDVGAAPGARDVVVTTGAEIAERAGAFQVEGKPKVTAVSPAQVLQGASVTLTLTGAYTTWDASSTVSVSGAGIAVGAPSVTSATSLTVAITVSADAGIGHRDLQVTTGTEVALGSGALEILPAPEITGASPASGNQGETLNVTVSGADTHFTSGTPAVSFGADITASNVAVVDDTHLTVDLAIAPAAAVGFRSAAVTTGAETATSAAAVFEVRPRPAVKTVTPSEAYQSETLNVSLEGLNTSWVNGVSTVSFGAGVTVGALTVTGATAAVAELTISGTATPGPRDVTVTTGTEVAVKPGAFTVKGRPRVNAVSPAQVIQGTAGVSFTLTGVFTSWTSASTVAFGGTGITATSVTASSATQLVVVADVAADAWTGLRDVQVTTGSEVAVGSDLLEVIPPAEVVGASPASGNQGQTVTVGLVGEDTHFTAATPAVTFSGTGLTTGAVTVTDDTHLSVVVTIDAAAQTGSRAVTVITGSETAMSPAPVFEVRPKPAVKSVTPTAAYQGETVNVSLEGLNTSWIDGTSAVSFGGGITVNALTVTGPAAAVAGITVSDTATPGPRDVTVTTGAEVAVKSPGFTVNGRPKVLSISPAAVIQGAGATTFTIDGVYTGFDATSSVSLGGSGITVTSVTPVNATRLTVLADVTQSATLGHRGVQVTTGGEVASSDPILEILPPPRVVAISPAQGDQGETLTLTISGQHTHFTAAVPTVDLGADVTVTGVTAVDDETLTATASIALAATLGGRTATVTTGTEVAPSTGTVFEILPEPAVQRVTPSTAFQGDTLYATLEGLNTSWIDGTSVADFGADITVRSLTVTGPTSAVAELRVDPAATPGPRDVQVTTGSEVTALTGGFTVEGRPRVISVSPGTVVQGTGGVVLLLRGAYTNWGATSTVSFSDTGLAITDVTVSSATQMTVTVDVSVSAPLGTRDVRVTTGSESAVGTSLLRVAAQIYLSAVSPSRATQGRTLTVEVTGVNTSFESGVSTVDFGAGLTVNSVSVTSPSRILTEVAIDPAAALGPRDVIVRTGSETAAGAALFTVDPMPYVDVVTPAGVLQGALTTVVITGVSTHFDGGSLVTFGAGVAVTGVSATGPTELAVDLAVAGDAVPGPRDVRVVTGQEVALGAAAFQVIPLPRILTVTPDTAMTGDSLDVIIEGLHTHFTDGTTSVDLGNGVGVTAVTVQDETHLTASLVISSKAAAGWRDVQVVTGGETALLRQGFTVGVRPKIARVVPAAAGQGQRLTLAVEGQGTTFTEGDVALELGEGVTVEEVRVAGTLRFEADVSVDLEASPGARDVVVTTSAGTLTNVGGFTVMPTPRILSCTPAAARRGDTVTVSLQGRNTTWQTGAYAMFGDGVVVSDLRCDDVTHCEADLVIEAHATLGTRDVTLIVADETAVGLGLFEILPKAEIVQVYPERVVQGDAATVTVVVSGTTIAAGADSVGFGAGVQVRGITLSDDGVTATCDVLLAADATPGTRDVSVITTDAGTLTGEALFRVQGRATVRSVSPSAWPQGEAVEITIIGDRTNFQAGLSALDPGDGVVVVESTVQGPDTMTARVRVAPDAALGPRDVVVSTGSEVAIGEASVQIVEMSTGGEGGGGAESGCSCSAGSAGGGWSGALFALMGLAVLRRPRR